MRRRLDRRRETGDGTCGSRAPPDRAEDCGRSRLSGVPRALSPRGNARHSGGEYVVQFFESKEGVAAARGTKRSRRGGLSTVGAERRLRLSPDSGGVLHAGDGKIVQKFYETVW